MRGLILVLQAKIALTVAFWCVPLLLFPTGILAELGFPVPVPEIFLRLLGMAYLALVLGYWFGLQQSRAGSYPSGTVRVGILSNGGACALLGLHGFQDAWSTWGAFAQLFMWASLAGAGAITAGLVVFGPGRAPAWRAAAASESPAARHP